VTSMGQLFSGQSVLCNSVYGIATVLLCSAVTAVVDMLSRVSDG